MFIKQFVSFIFQKKFQLLLLILVLANPISSFAQIPLPTDMGDKAIDVKKDDAAIDSPPKKDSEFLDLGFDEKKFAPDPELQEKLEKRSRMLKKHQLFGLLTAIPMAATLVTSGFAGSSSGWRETHMALGIATFDLYFTSAYYAIFAPKPDGIKDKGGTKIHRALAYVHLPAMLATPVLGYLAKRQDDRHETLHGGAQYHNIAAGTLAISYGLALTVMLFNIDF